MATADFGDVFQRLRSILLPYAATCVVKTDTDAVYHLDTTHMQPNKAPLMFAAAAIKKNYVSYYLFPVYVWPELLAGLSPELRRRMQGKSCFNFTRSEEPLLTELAQLTAAGAQRFRAQQGLVP